MNEDFEVAYARYLSGAMDHEERRSFEEGVLADPALAEEVFADQELQAALEATPRDSGWRGLWNWAVPVAAALAMFLFAQDVDVPRPGAEPRLRGASVIELHEPRGELASAPARFVWSPAPGAARYRVEVLDVSGRLRSSRVTADTFLVPGDPIPDEGAWSVVVLDDLGTALARSTPARYRVVPPR